MLKFPERLFVRSLQALIVAVCIFGAFHEPEGPTAFLGAGLFACAVIPPLYMLPRAFIIWLYGLTRPSKRTRWSC